jgi:hypothetical protein
MANANLGIIRSYMLQEHRINVNENAICAAVSHESLSKLSDYELDDRNSIPFQTGSTGLKRPDLESDPSLALQTG